MIGTIEQAMIDRAEALSAAGSLGYRFGQVDSYAGQFDEDVSEVVRDFPLVFFAWSGEWADPLSLGDSAWQYRPVFAAIVGVKSLRNEKATRHGGPSSGEVGSYQVVTDLRAMFTGQRLGLGIRPFEPGPARSLFNRRVNDLKISVLVAEFRTEYVGVPLAEELADFETFHADWDIPPHGTYDSVPLADGEADAQDTVTLEIDT